MRLPPVAIAFFFASSTGMSAPDPTGDDFQLNLNNVGFQVLPSVAACGPGQFVVAWGSEGQDGDSDAVVARRFGPGGTPTTDELQVNAYAVGSQAAPAIACRPSGEFVVAWQSQGQDGDEWGVYGRRFDVNGRPRGPEFRINQWTVGTQRGPRVSMDASGNFVVVWESMGQDGSEMGVYARRYRADGLPRGSEFRVNQETIWSQDLPSLSVAPDGSFVVVWQSWKQDGQSWGIYGRRYGPTAQPLGSEFRVNTTTAWHQFYPSVSHDEGGGFIVTWSGTAYGDDLEIFMQRYGPDGSAVGPEYFANDGRDNLQILPVVVGRLGGTAVLWLSLDEDGEAWGVFGQLFDRNGDREGAQFAVNTTTAGTQYDVALAPDSDGNLFVAWDSEEGPDDFSIRGRVFEFTYDTGDAPESYGTLRAHDGARHRQPSDLYLGLGATTELDGKPGALADSDEDDGVVFPEILRPGRSATVAVTASQVGRLDAWFDWNVDGDWEDADEHAVADLPLAAGDNSIPVQVPAAARVGPSHARFRISSLGGLASGGFAPDGEVEDFRVAIEPVGVAIAPSTTVEGDTGSRLARFTVSLTAPSSQPVQVGYSTKNGTAESGQDYLARSGRLTFLPGTTERTILIPVFGDYLIEPPEHFSIELSNAAAASILDASALGSIVNDDESGTIQLSSSGFTVGEQDGVLQVVVERSGGVASGAGVVYETLDGSAGPADYQPVSGLLQFEGGVVRKTLRIAILPDREHEATESFRVRLLSTIGGATLGAQVDSTATLVDDDPPPVLQFNTGSLTTLEKAGRALAVVVRTGNLAGTVTVDYATRDGSAVAPGDYGARSGTLTFGAGVSSQTLLVPIVHDKVLEGPETAEVTVMNPQGAVLGARSVLRFEIIDRRPTP